MLFVLVVLSRAICVVVLLFDRCMLRVVLVEGRSLVEVVCLSRFRVVLQLVPLVFGVWIVGFVGLWSVVRCFGVPTFPS